MISTEKTGSIDKWTVQEWFVSGGGLKGCRYLLW